MREEEIKQILRIYTKSSKRGRNSTKIKNIKNSRKRKRNQIKIKNIKDPVRETEILKIKKSNAEN